MHQIFVQNDIAVLNFSLLLCNAVHYYRPTEGVVVLWTSCCITYPKVWSSNYSISHYSFPFYNWMVSVNHCAGFVLHRSICWKDSGAVCQVLELSLTTLTCINRLHYSESRYFVCPTKVLLCHSVWTPIFFQLTRKTLICVCLYDIAFFTVLKYTPVVLFVNEIPFLLIAKFAIFVCNYFF